jgi:hypothetical protein
MIRDWTADGGGGEARDFLLGWMHRVFGSLERWLADRDFVVTGDFTVADIAVCTKAKQNREGRLTNQPRVLPPRFGAALLSGEGSSAPKYQRTPDPDRTLCKALLEPEVEL